MSVELYKHNKEAYEQVEEHFKTSNKTCVIHPTGTGKSFISLKFIDDNINKNILLLAPTNVILDQFCTNIAEQILKVDTSRMSQKEVNDLVSSRLPNITLSTYASAKNQTSNYDCIICDEFHRIGADTWGAGVKAIMDNNPNAKVLGVTATPIRYLDDMRDMSEEIFEGDIASQMTLPEAIVKGILPVPTYISTLYSFEEDIDEIQKQIDNYKDRKQAEEYQKLLNQAKKELQESEGLDEIFAKNIQNKNGRFIVFCRNKEHMKDMEEKCKEWFKKTNPDIEISEVYSDQGKELNQYYIEYFENNERKTIKLLFSIEMLNEGLHVDNIDGVIMFRPTSSPIVYMQQLGRALSVGHNEHPLVFDIVNNSSSLDSIIEVKDQVEKLIDDIIISRENGNPNKDYPDNEILLKIKEGFKVLEEKKEIIDILETLKVDSKFSWDDWYKLAKKYYEQYGNLDVKQGFVTLDGVTELKEDDSRYEEGFKLGLWISKQRQVYKGNGNGKLTEEQIRLLKEIGMRFENIDLMQEWMKKYELAKKYYEQYGNLEVKTKFVTLDGVTELKEGDPRYEDGFKLGQWISKQRQVYKGNGNGKLTEEQIRLLKEIGMRFENIDLMQEWMKKYELAKKYYEQYGNLEVKTKFVTLDGVTELKEGDPRYEDGFNLGRWIIRQRQIYKGKADGKLTDEQIRLLEDLKIKWMPDTVDDRSQKEDITEKNKLQKKTEVLNRFQTLLNEYNGESLPNREEISDDFMNQLNRKKK